ncbi:uncharacterized protein SPPG_00656 [Spizellomyces punctatus DAOM BR117]|uniref:Kinesin motor domain-containing protein n=1 Tax=Spizellomyces punctatus (strain DAOM BR117) TaxID=645134 RepID=A0A0L0HVR1_SPIPD|nr:uncharacterized protein SPPG_00656 [Spizellomyces punctatus DAOM BR117]KND04969.1 hypothetical protein SPPG_00656 [Spizellomyces punctatus DAOM BR117]|eukprot:XP_016613008.1 hypothetical protein SPPG_00656 [Spizellomyces punctatus DAOM BR117]
MTARNSSPTPPSTPSPPPRRLSVASTASTSTLLSSSTATTSTIKVALRIRPPVSSQPSRGSRQVVQVLSDDTPTPNSVVVDGRKRFTFDSVFGPDHSQHDVYEAAVAPLVERFLEGYNATVMAYGQTGSGKTYTMGTAMDVAGFGWDSAEADDPREGIVARAIKHIFSAIDNGSHETGGEETKFDLSVSFIEMYNEDLIDLLTVPPMKGVTVREDPRGGIYWAGAREENVENVEEALRLLTAGLEHRQTTSTTLNQTSSRSHAIFSLQLCQRRWIPGNTADTGDAGDWQIVNSKFHFVDLAGSERLKRTKAVGERQREGISINSGLLALGNVINALGGEQATRQGGPVHVPYRDSKLTRLLQDGLGGNSQTAMIACISPCEADLGETLNTLLWANRGRNIRNTAFVNHEYQSEVRALKEQVARLKGEVGKHAPLPSNDADRLREENDELKKQLESLTQTQKSLRQRNDYLANELALVQSESVMMRIYAASPTPSATPSESSDVPLHNGQDSVIDFNGSTMSSIPLPKRNRIRPRSATSAELIRDLLISPSPNLPDEVSTTDDPIPTQATVRKLRAELRETTLAARQYLSQVDSLQTRLREREAEFEEAEQALQEEISELKALNAGAEDYIAGLEVQLTKHQALADQVERLETELEREREGRDADSGGPWERVRLLEEEVIELKNERKDVEVAWIKVAELEKELEEFRRQDLHAAASVVERAAPAAEGTFTPSVVIPATTKDTFENPPSDILSLRAAVSDLWNQLLEQETRTAELVGSEEDHRVAREEIQSKLKTLQSQLSQLEAEHNVPPAPINTTSTIAPVDPPALHSLLAESNQAYAALESEVAQLRQVASDAVARAAKLESENTALEQAREGAFKEVEERVKGVEQVLENLRMAEEANEELHNGVKELEGRMEALMKEKEELETLLKERENDLVQRDDRVEELEGHLKALENEIGEMKTAAAETATRSLEHGETLKGDLEGLREHVKELEGLLQHARDEKVNVEHTLQARVTDLEAEIDKAQQAVDTSRSEADNILKELQNEITSLHTDLSKARDQLSDSSSRTAELEQSLETEQRQASEAQAKLVAAEDAITTLRSELEAAAHEAHSLASAIHEADEKVRTAAQDRDAIQAERDSIIAERNALISELESLKSALEEATSHHETLSREIHDAKRQSVLLSDEKDKEREALQMRVAELEKEVEDAAGRLDAVVKEHETALNTVQSELAEKADNMATELANTQSHAKELEEEVETLRSGRVDLEEQLDAKMSEIESLTAHIDELERGVDEKDGQLEGLRADLSGLSKQLEEKQHVIDELLQKTEGYETELTDARQKVEELGRDLLDKGRELDQVTHQLDDVRTGSDRDLAEARTKLVELEDIHSGIVEAHAASEQHRTQLADEVEGLKAALEAKTRDLEALVTQLEELQIENGLKEDKVRDEVQVLKTELDVLQANVSTVTSERDEALQKIEDIVKELNRIVEGDGELDTVLTGAKSLVQDLRDGVKERDDRLGVVAQECEELTTRIGEIQQLLDQKHTEISERDTVVSDLRATLAALTTELDESKARVNELEAVQRDLHESITLRSETETQKVQEVQKLLDDKHAELAQQETVVAELQTTVAALRTELTESKERISELETVHRELHETRSLQAETENQQVAQIQKLLDEKQAELAQRETDLSDLQATLTALRTELNQSTDRVQELEAAQRSIEEARALHAETENQKMEQLQQLLDDKQAELAQREVDLSDLQTTLAALRIELETAQRSIEEARALQAETENQKVEQLQQLLDDKQAEAAQRETQLSDLQTTLSSLRTELDEKQAELAHREAEVSDLQSALTASRTELDEKQGELAQREADVADLQTALSTLRTQLDDSSVHVNELETVQRELEESRRLQSESQNLVSDLQAQLEALHVTLTETQDQLATELESSRAHEHEASELESGLLARDESNKALQNQLSESEVEKQALMDRVHQLETHCEDYAAKIGKFAKEVQYLASLREAVVIERDELLDKVNALEEQILHLQNESVQGTERGLEIESTRPQADVAQLDRECNDLLNGLGLAETQVETTSAATILDLENKMRTAEALATELEQNLSDTQQERDMLLVRMKELEHSNAEMEKEMIECKDLSVAGTREMEDRLGRMEVERDEALTKLQQLEAKVEELNSSLEEKETALQRIAELDALLESKDQELKDVQSQLSSLASTHETLKAESTDLREKVESMEKTQSERDVVPNESATADQESDDNSVLVGMYRTQIAEVVSERNSLRTEIEQLGTELGDKAKLEDELAQVVTERDELKQVVEALSNRVEEVEAKLNEAERRVPVIVDPPPPSRVSKPRPPSIQTGREADLRDSDEGDIGRDSLDTRRSASFDRRRRGGSSLRGLSPGEPISPTSIIDSIREIADRTNDTEATTEAGPGLAERERQELLRMIEILSMHISAADRQLEEDANTVARLEAELEDVRASSSASSETSFRDVSRSSTAVRLRVLEDRVNKQLDEIANMEYELVKARSVANAAQTRVVELENQLEEAKKKEREARAAQPLNAAVSKARGGHRGTFRLTPLELKEIMPSIMFEELTRKDGKRSSILTGAPERIQSAAKTRDRGSGARQNIPERWRDGSPLPAKRDPPQPDSPSSDPRSNRHHTQLAQQQHQHRLAQQQEIIGELGHQLSTAKRRVKDLQDQVQSLEQENYSSQNNIRMLMERVKYLEESRAILPPPPDDTLDRDGTSSSSSKRSRGASRGRSGSKEEGRTKSKSRTRSVGKEKDKDGEVKKKRSFWWGGRGKDEDSD